MNQRTKRHIFILSIILLLLLATAAAVSAVPISPGPVTVELGTNQTVTVRCTAPVVDEVIFTPTSDREATVTCRTYVTVAEND